MPSAPTAPAPVAAGPRFVSAADGACFYSVSVATFRRWAARGTVPRGHRIGGRKLWILAELEDHARRLGSLQPLQAAAGREVAR
jgi:hypothetical protein